MTQVTLAAKAQRLETAVLTKCLDPDGLLLFFTRRPDMGPPDEVIRQIDPGFVPHVTAIDRAVYFKYENSNQAAGKFIAAMSYRYAATQDPAAAASARVPFRHLCKAFDWAIAVGEPGFLPKVYGGLRGEYARRETYHETSLDQMGIPCFGLWQFWQKVATTQEAERIANYFRLAGHWWMSHDYLHMYGGKLKPAFDSARPYRSGIYKIFVAMHAGAKATNDAALLAEVERWVGKAIKADTLRLYDQYMPETKDYVNWAQGAYYFMTESEIAGRDYWLDLIDGYWRAAKTSLLPDIGLSMAMGQFDAQAWRLKPYQSGDSIDPQWGYQGPIPSPAMSCDNAWLGILAYELGLDDDAPAWSRAILEQLDETNLAEVLDLKDDLPAVIRWRSQIIPTEAVGQWLGCYWHGKLVGAW